MRDAIFSGRDVADALEQAGRALGFSPHALRYVVLERGTAGLLGMGGTPARIAVLLDASGGGPGSAGRPAEARRLADPAAGVRSIVARLAESAGVELAAELDEDSQILGVQLVGAGTALLLEQEGAALRALEYVLQRSYARALAPRRLQLDCQGYRELRDQRLRARALELAAAVRGDSRARTTEALNAYERRVIHLALAEQPDLVTYSVGEGSGRRVTIAPRHEPEAP